MSCVREPGVSAWRVWDALLRGGEEFRPVEEAVRAIEHRDEGRAVGRMRDMDIAAGPPDKIARAAAAPVSYTHLTLPTIYSV